MTILDVGSAAALEAATITVPASVDDPMVIVDEAPSVTAPVSVTLVPPAAPKAATTFGPTDSAFARVPV